jgi:hypothetical protein
VRGCSELKTSSRLRHAALIGMGAHSEVGLTRIESGQGPGGNARPARDRRSLCELRVREPRPPTPHCEQGAEAEEQCCERCACADADDIPVEGLARRHLGLG